jgi:solute carrier family 25 carnitine/acylcarnitine transporter 20/29
VASSSSFASVFLPAQEAALMSLSRTSKDVLSGTAGGIAQVFVGQPLDIIKVRLQTAQKGTYNGLVDCASQILKAEGPLGFYRVCAAS